MRGARLAAALVVVALLPACAAAPRAFLRSSEVEITSPTALEIVTLPMTVSWTLHGAGHHVQYAVFVDRSPVPPGHSLRDVADDQCRRIAGCPDAGYLQARGIYVTASTQVRIGILPFPPGDSRGIEHPAHRLVVVVLDEQGQRAGDDAWAMEFRG